MIPESDPIRHVSGSSNRNNPQDWSNEEMDRVISIADKNYNVDFSGYAKASLSRRITHLIKISGLNGIDDLINRIEKDKSFKPVFVNEVTVGATEMFRDPEFWIALKHKILPELLTKQEEIRIWITGCSTGEEVYSLSILLNEMKVYDRVRVIATDLDKMVLETSKNGFYYHHSYDKNLYNYSVFEGQKTLNSYLKKSKLGYHMNPGLLDNVRFKAFDLVKDQMNDQFDIVFCRNVLIYFNQSLQNSVLKKFNHALVDEGYLALGAKESIMWTDNHHQFRLIHTKEKIYQLN